ncbi:hypothetical protein JOB18_007322 [Solea senegalensis]|uniref:Uncharacterized protein n=1 Tax=Solea senegalensis TaxID=28829 RepID=A0AAV6RFQ2_SOLSE|nr:hypothetical protein JOB18_007322 [Solea senegalensis]
MSNPVHLRVVLGGDDARKLSLMSGIPASVDQLVHEIKTAVSEINAEFMRITTLPLQAKFLGEVDKYTPNLMKFFSGRGGAAGKKTRLLMAPTTKSEDIEEGLCTSRSLCLSQ